MYYSSGFRTGFHFVDLKYHSFSKKKKEHLSKGRRNWFWGLIFGNGIDDDQRERERKVEKVRVDRSRDKFKLSCFNPTVNLAVSSSKIKQLH